MNNILALFFPKKRRGQQRVSGAIVPRQTVTGTALVVVIAIMTFLAGLSAISVSLVAQSAAQWKQQIAREATIQIIPLDGVDMDQALRDAAQIAQGFSGVVSAQIMNEAATAHLLDSFFGENFDYSDLPVPRMVLVAVDQSHLPDFETMGNTLRQNVPGASLDYRSSLTERPILMANATITIGILIFGLVVIASILSVVFATRGALAANEHIVEVLHFIGADLKYIAHQFDGYFLITAFKGAFCGGLAALLVFLMAALWSAGNMATPQGDQMQALFGSFSLQTHHFIVLLVLIISISVLTMITSHMTLMRHLRSIDRQDGRFF